MLPTAAVFTDTYLPTVNGVTYTIRTWRSRWADRGGEMPVVYPDGDGYDPEAGEWPVRSVSLPFYNEYNVGLPAVPDSLAATDPDLVHAHTPFLLGLSGLRYAGSHDLPLVASYHTPTAEYADYISEGWLQSPIERAARRYETWYLEHADVVVVPSDPAREALRNQGVSAPVEVVPNGVDIDQFRPVEGDAFRRAHDLPRDRPLVGYTGRHGYEKRLDLLVEAADGLDATVVFGGDGPARERLEERAAAVDADVRFLGFLDRCDLPAFYSALDVFAFPSPVETQGLVALEATACGTPVAAVDAGALSDTIRNGENGYRGPPSDVAAFRATIERTLAERETLRERCLDSREAMSVEHAVDSLTEVYDQVRTEA
ncbi:MAG: glycosyltransferase [Halorientalis sp.]